MQHFIETQMHKFFGRSALFLAVSSVAFFLPRPLAAQQTGPLPPPPSYSAPPPLPRPGSAPVSTPHQTTTESPLSTEPPKIPPEQIIQKFADRELEFKKERDNYTYTQTVIVQTIDDYSGRPTANTGSSLKLSLILKASALSTTLLRRLRRFSVFGLDQQDKEDLEHVQPFVLTTDELPKYDVKYVGQQQLDEINTYVFDVASEEDREKSALFPGAHLGRPGRYGNCQDGRKGRARHQERGLANIFTRVLKRFAKISKAITGFRPTRTRTTLCNSAAAEFTCA